jgi:hypothetical protein
MPICRTRCRKASPSIRSRSRRRYRGASSHGNASTTRWAVHAAVGCSVRLSCTICRRSCARITRTTRTWYVAVGTTKTSMDTTSLTGFCRNAFHVGEGGFRGRTRHVSTVELGHLTASRAPLAHHPGRAPCRVRPPHVPDQLAHLLGHGRTTRRASRAQVPPVVAASLTWPGEDRVGLGTDACCLPTRPEA